jgi:hypothetical protein
MSRNGSGTYSLPSGNPVVSGTTITSTWANTTLNDMANALTGSLASDGQTPLTGSLNAGGNQITNAGDPTSAQAVATKNYVDVTIGATYLAKANNLSDVASATTSRTNLVAAKSGSNSDITNLTALGSSTASALTTPNIVEPVTVNASAPTATTTYDVATQSVVYYTSNNTVNFTLNIRGSSTTALNALIGIGQSITLTLMVTNGTTAYYPNVIQIDGTAVTVKWQNATAVTAGNPSCIDVYCFAIIKTASATFTVIGSQSKFA